MKRSRGFSAPKISFFILLALALSSCLTAKFDEPAPSKGATNMKELVAPTNFSWTTSQQVEVSIIGLPTTIPITSMLKLEGKTDAYYTGSHLMSANQTLVLSIPASEKELTLSYGSVVLKSAITDGKVSFSLIPNYIEPTL